MHYDHTHTYTPARPLVTIQPELRCDWSLSESTVIRNMGEMDVTGSGIGCFRACAVLTFT